MNVPSTCSIPCNCHQTHRKVNSPAYNYLIDVKNAMNKITRLNKRSRQGNGKWLRILTQSGSYSEIIFLRLIYPKSATGSYFSFQRRGFLVWAFFSSLESDSRIWKNRCRLLSAPLKPAHQEWRATQERTSRNKKNTRTRKTRRYARGRQKRAHEKTKKTQNAIDEKKQKKQIKE